MTGRLPAECLGRSPECGPDCSRRDRYEPAATATQVDRVRRAHVRGGCPFRADSCGWETCPKHADGPFR